MNLAKINILKSRLNGKRCGEFTLTDNYAINLKVGFQKKPEFKKELFELLNKYFNVITLNQKSRHNKWRKVGRIFSRKQNRKKYGKKRNDTDKGVLQTL